MSSVKNQLREFYSSSPDRISVDQKKIMVYVASQLNRVGIRPNASCRAGLKNLLIGCDSERMKLLEGDDPSFRTSLQFNHECFLCHHIPYTPRKCARCSALYCSGCSIFMARASKIELNIRNNRMDSFKNRSRGPIRLYSGDLW